MDGRNLPRLGQRSDDLTPRALLCVRSVSLRRQGYTDIVSVFQCSITDSVVHSRFHSQVFLTKLLYIDSTPSFLLQVLRVCQVGRLGGRLTFVPERVPCAALGSVASCLANHCSTQKRRRSAVISCREKYATEREC